MKEMRVTTKPTYRSNQLRCYSQICIGILPEGVNLRKRLWAQRQCATHELKRGVTWKKPTTTIDSNGKFILPPKKSLRRAKSRILAIKEKWVTLYATEKKSVLPSRKKRKPIRGEISGRRQTSPDTRGNGVAPRVDFSAKQTGFSEKLGAQSNSATMPAPP